MIVYTRILLQHACLKHLPVCLFHTLFARWFSDVLSRGLLKIYIYLIFLKHASFSLYVLPDFFLSGNFGYREFWICFQEDIWIFVIIWDFSNIHLSVSVSLYLFSLGDVKYREIYQTCHPRTSSDLYLCQQGRQINPRAEVTAYRCLLQTQKYSRWNKWHHKVGKRWVSLKGNTLGWFSAILTEVDNFPDFL